MSNRIARSHLERLRVAILRRQSMGDLAQWICENTTIGGQPFTFLDHEYQERILGDTSQESAVQKPSQVGMSEATARLALAAVSVINPLTAIYTLPTANFAAKFMKTRIDPVISGSKVLREGIHKTNDNSEFKQFGDSFLYLKGAASSNAPISIPADLIINDEIDFSDQEVITQYYSRLTHSRWKMVRRFSTPTLPGYGINKAFTESRRNYNLVKCHRCNHWFYPDYYQHVQIPGYTGDLRGITKSSLSRIAWQEAKVICPKCGGEPSLQPEHREWNCENKDEALIGVGWQISPFDAPNIIKPSDLVRASTNYARIQDFVNFGLGLPMEDAEATLTRSDILNLFALNLSGSTSVHVMGVDVGNVYHFVVGSVDGHGDINTVHVEQVPMGMAKARYRALRAQYRTVCTVIDSGPHAETVMALQEEDPNLYASVYMRSKSILPYTVKTREEEPQEGQEFVRQVDVNRSRAFDAYMNFIRENHLSIRTQTEELEELIIGHHTSMKRVKIFDNDSGEMSYSWQKTDGQDHFHHAFLYMWIASRIRGIGKPLIVLPTSSIQAIRLRARG